MIDWPLDDNIIRGGKLSNTFGSDVRRRADGSAKGHQGWDLEADLGTPFFAIADGKIVAVRSGGDYGLVVIQSFTYEGRALFAAFAHLQSASVRVGDTVTRGQQLGRTGESGNARGMAKKDRHLHFEIRTSAVPGPGMIGRISPLQVFVICPLKTSVKRTAA